MYTPKEYATNDQNEMISFMKTYSFATIITVKDNFQTATHLPFVVQKNEQTNEITLFSHFAKANQQWAEIMENEVLVIFAEPHAYISPTHYESPINVPTWNYVAVHAYGKGEILHTKQASIDVLEMMIDSYEPEYRVHWNVLPHSYKSKLITEIVAFKITIKDLKATKKISQNRRPKEKENIINYLQKSEHTNEKDIAEMMKKIP